MWDTAADREAYTLTVPEATPPPPTLADSGHLFVSVGGGWARRLGAAGGPVARIRVGHSYFARGAFSPAGRLLATFDVGQTVKLWDRDTGERVAAYDWKIGRGTHAAFSPDGLTLAVGGDKRAEVVVFDLDA